MLIGFGLRYMFYFWVKVELVFFKVYGLYGRGMIINVKFGEIIRRRTDGCWGVSYCSSKGLIYVRVVSFRLNFL